MFSVDEKTKKQFYQQFGRTEKMVRDDVATIKTWLQSQPHLPEIMDDTKIGNFLNMNKFSIEKTKQKIDMYYTMRGLIPEMFKNPNCEDIQRSLNDMQFGCFPQLSNGTRVIFFNFLTPNTFRPIVFITLFFAIFEIRISEDFMTDDIIIFDRRNFTMNDSRKLTPVVAIKAWTAYQKIFSMRMKKGYYINCPSSITMLVSIFKMVLKPKIFNRLEFHEDDKILREIFSKEELPKDYGGDGSSLQDMTELMRKKMVEYQNRFDFLENAKVDESLRPEKLDNDEILGFYGNFKKLDID